jgi:hypothetical protein
MQGFGAGQAAGKRGVYATGATLALLSEGNRRLDIFIKRIRAPFHKIGRKTALAYNQFDPGSFDRFGKKGAMIRQAFALADEQSRALLYDLSASDSADNQEVDRQNLLQMGNTMAVYYEKVLSLASAYRQLPENDPLRPIALMVLDGARDLARRLLFAFKIGDRDRLLPDAAKVLQGQQGQQGQAVEPGGAPGTAPAVQPSQLEAVLQGIASASGRSSL